MGSSSWSPVSSQQHFGPRHGELEAFAAHGLDEDAELKLAAAGDLHGVALLGFRHLEGDIAFGLAQQAVADHAARDLRAFGAGERRIVDPEGHGKRRRIDRLSWKRGVDLGRADRVRDGRVGQAGERDDVARGRLVEADTLEPAEGEHFRHAALLDEPAVVVEHLHHVVRLDRARGDAAGDDASEIRVGFEDGAEQAERTLLDPGRRHVAQHEVEQRPHALVLRAVDAFRHPAFLGRAIKNREVELLLSSRPTQRRDRTPRSAPRPAVRRRGRPC